MFTNKVGVNSKAAADPPNPDKIPVADLIGNTVILITCAYLGQDFIQIGYYVNNEYDDPELQENLPEKPILEKIYRNILASDPRVKKFKIVWDSPNIIQTADDEDNYLPMY